MSAIQLSDFEHKFTNPSDVLHDALTGRFIEASKVMTPNGFKVYLDGAGALNSMGKGEDMVISFLEEQHKDVSYTHLTLTKKEKV